MPNITNTLCWDCGRACRDQCCWAAAGKPVPGWTATKTVIRSVANVASYIIHDCTQYIRDSVSKLKAKDLDNTGCAKLLAAMAANARSDYIHNPRNREEVEWWLEGKPEMIRELRELAAAEDERRGLRHANYAKKTR